MKKEDIRDRLFKVISDFSSQMEKPLPSLEQWEHESTEDHEPNFLENRKHIRQDASVYGIYETKDSQFRASTKNVSSGGVLVDPELHLSLHEDLYMTLFSRKLNAPVRTHGKIVRVGSDGAGIQFDQVIPAMSFV